MRPAQNQNPSWNVLLIGGSSGVGKTVVARELARRLSVSLLLLDDVRLALQKATTKETNPDLHVFLDYPADRWRYAETICADWITVGKAMSEPLQAIIHHHLIVPDVGPVIIEGDGILPMRNRQLIDAGNIRTVFLFEEDEGQLLHNLRLRGRGFEEWDELQQKGFAHASWLYGQWLVQESRTLHLPVIDARPQGTALDRLLSAIDKKQ